MIVFIPKDQKDTVYYESKNKTHLCLLSPPIQFEQLFDAWIWATETQKSDAFSLQVKRIDYIGWGWKLTVWYLEKLYSLEALCFNLGSQLHYQFSKPNCKINFILLMFCISCLSFHLLTLLMLHLIISLCSETYTLSLLEDS